MFPTCQLCGANLIEVENNESCCIMACMYCDMPREEDHFYIYRNHCWNCGYGIDSRFSAPSPIPNMGYVCGHCGKDLTEWKLRTGQLTLTELFVLKGAYKCYSTATNVLVSPGIQ